MTKFQEKSRTINLIEKNLLRSWVLHNEQ